VRSWGAGLRFPWKLLATTGAVAIAVIAWLWHDAPPAAEHALTPDDATVVDRGEQVYTRHCATCHGMSLEGQRDWRTRAPDGRLRAPPHDESGHTWHHTDEALFQMTKFGPSSLVSGGYPSNMPGYDGVLSDADVVAVLSYIKSTWSAEIRRHHDARNARRATR